VSQLSSTNKHQPECPLAHKLINKLSTVIGNCDLIVEKTPGDSPILQRMLLIRDTAKSMAADLAEFQCELARRRAEERQRASVAS
jgi:hypothetical protein